MKSNYCFI